MRVEANLNSVQEARITGQLILVAVDTETHKGILDGTSTCSLTEPELGGFVCRQTPLAVLPSPCDILSSRQRHLQVHARVCCSPVRLSDTGQKVQTCMHKATLSHAALKLFWLASAHSMSTDTRHCFLQWLSVSSFSDSRSPRCPFYDLYQRQR